MNLRQAAQALLNHWEAGEFKNCTGDMAGHIQVLREALAQSEQRPANFYLSPPQREWVGLTDDEIAKYWGDAFAGNTQYVQKFARIIEAKIKEKNT